MSRLDHPLPSEATSGMEMLSRKFERLKSDFRAQFGTSFDLLRDTAIYDTPLYKFLERMPKVTPEWEIRFIGPGAPYGSRTMQECLDDGLTVDDFRRNWTVAGAPRNGYVWNWFKGAWKQFESEFGYQNKP